MKTYSVLTKSGSIYHVDEDDKGNYWLSGNNVPNPDSSKLPNTPIKLHAQPTPWPPKVGFAWNFRYASPVLVGGERWKLTSAVEKVTCTPS